MPEIFRANHFNLGTIWAFRSENAGPWEVRTEVDMGPILQRHADAPENEPPDVVAHKYVRGWSKCGLGFGEHHPRVWRGNPSPGSARYEREWANCYGAVSNLIRRMVETFRFIEPNVHNANTYGHETRQLLIVAATEVESSWRAVLAANGYRRDAEHLNTRDFVRLCRPMRLREWRIALDAHPDFDQIAPFATWDAEESTKSLPWYDAYNAVKHDRERNFAQANLLNAVTAVAAAYIMVLAQFGEFDNRHFLGLDEFRQASTPKFEASESYVPPAVGGLGRDAWTPKPLVF